MLTIKTRLLPSPIEGLGVFADEPVSEGQEVWVFMAGLDNVLPRMRFDQLPLAVRAFMERYGALEDGSVYLDGDDARFINHSNVPNLKTGKGTTVMVAARTISLGEELTCDYRAFDDPSRRGDEPYVGVPPIQWEEYARLLRFFFCNPNDPGALKQVAEFESGNQDQLLPFWRKWQGVP